MTLARDEATRLLEAWDDGDDAVRQRLFTIVYEDLKQVARKHLRDERGGLHTLTTTDLVYESYLRLVRQETVGSHSRAQFLASASRVMRRVLIDHARRRGAEKRGGSPTRMPLFENLRLAEADLDRLLTVDEVLVRLNDLDERLARVVEFRFFGGMPSEEIAEVLNVSVRTVERDWARARAYLHTALSADSDVPAS